MSQLPILTTEFVRRMERFAAPELSGSAEKRASGVPIVASFGQTIASKARGGRPANKVFCFGAEDLAYLDEILAFYAVDELNPTFYLSPVSFTREVGAALTAAGFAQTEYQQAILYGLPMPEPVPLPFGITIERVTEHNRDAYVQTLAEGFEWPDTWRNAAIEDTLRNLSLDSYHFLARYQGEPAGVASLGMRDNIASLGGGAVIPALRGKGCHQALIHHRLFVAHEIGSPLVMGGADFGSASFRNQQRAGLRLAYIESGWSRK